MTITIERKWRKDDYTIGNLYVDGVFFCNTLEDRDRFFFGQEKVKGKTAIPVGEYRVNMRRKSPKFSLVDFYKRLCNGCVPYLVNVPQFSGILIHAGNTAEDTEGCILVGKNTVVGKVMDSRATFTKLYVKMKAADDRGEEVNVKIY